MIASPFFYANAKRVFLTFFEKINDKMAKPRDRILPKHLEFNIIYLVQVLNAYLVPVGPLKLPYLFLSRPIFLNFASILFFNGPDRQNLRHFPKCRFLDFSFDNYSFSLLFLSKPHLHF